MAQKVIAEYNDIKAVADAIRTKKNITGDMLLKDMPSNVLSIEGGIDTSDATITPETVFLNETGYANGQKVTGTFTIEDEVTAQENLIAQIESALEGKAAGGGSAEIATGTFVITDNGMYEPGVNEFVFTASNLNTSSKHIIVIFSPRGFVIGVFKRENLSDSFVFYDGASDSIDRVNIGVGSGNHISYTENQLTIYGEISSSVIDSITFFAV